MNRKSTTLFPHCAAFIAVFLLLTSVTRADHIIGSDFSYSCSSTNDSIFDVVYNFYRDCNGCYVLGQSPKCGTSENCASSSTAPTSLSVKCLSGGSFSGTLTMSRSSITDITKTCKNVKSRCAQPCNGSFPYGIEKHSFTGTLDLRQAMRNGCCNFEISALLYVRNVGITTGQSQQPFYTSCEINTCKASCNTSPTLTNDPVAILCCNQPYVFNNGAVDFADNDSISYSFVPSYRGQGQQCTYSGQRSPANPITTYYPNPLKFPYANPNANPPIGTFLDPQTGDIIFTPTKCGEVAVVVIQMTEWRKDSTGKYQKIGVTRRDMQFIVMSCPDNNPPSITNTKFTHRVCEGAQICFNVTTEDKVKKPPPPLPTPDPDTVQLRWNAGIPGATFKVINPTARLKTGQFCWTPPVGTSSTLPYSFTATVNDDACPLAASATRAFLIYVDPMAEAERDIDTFDCGKYSVESTPFPNFKYPAKYLWQILDTNGLIIFDKNIARFLSTGSFISTKQSDSIQFRKGGTYIIQHVIENKPNCPTTYYDTLVVPPLLEIDLAFGEDTFVCAGTTLRLKPIVRNSVPTVDFTWGNGDTTSFLDVELSSNNRDSAFYVEIKDGSGCTAWDSTMVFLKENPYVFIGDDRRICTYDTIHLIPNDSLAYWVDPRDTSNTPVVQGDTLYTEWFLNGTSIGTDSSLTGLNLPGEYVIKVSDSIGCFDTDTVILAVNDTVSANAGMDQTLCWNDFLELIGTELDTAGKSKSGSFYWWDINDPNNKISHGTKDTLAYNIKTSTTFQLELFVSEDTTTCYDADTVSISVNPLPQVSMPGPLAVCFDAGVINLRLSEDANASGGVWSCPGKPSMVDQGYLFQTDSSGAETSTKKFQVHYTFVDPSTGCVKVDSFEITVNYLPKVELRDGYFCQDKEVVNVVDDKIIIRPGGGTLSLGRQAWKCVECDGYNESDIIEDINGGGPGATQDYVLHIDEKAIPLGSAEADTISLEMEFRNVFGCYNRDTVNVAITKVPKINFNAFPELCWDAGLVDLKALSNVTPYDGIWKAIDSTGFAAASGLNAALTGDTLNEDYLNTLQTPQPPEGGDRKYAMRFFHDRSGCPTWRDTTLTILGLPDPKIDHPPLQGYTMVEPYQICELDDDIEMTANYSGPGGVWSADDATAMSGSTFRPGSVSTTDPFYIHFDYTNTKGCKGKDSVQVVVHERQTITLSNDTAFCRTGDNMSLNVTASYTNSTGLTWIPLNGSGTVTDNRASNTTFNITPRADSIDRLLLYALTDEGGGSVCPFAEATMVVTVHPVPTVSVAADTLNGCNPVMVNFTTTMTNYVDPATSSFDWTYQPDGGIDNLQNPSHEFNTPGTHDVQLTVTSDFGCVSVLDTTVDVYPIPQALFTPNPNNSTTAALPKFQFNNESTVEPILNSVIVDNIWDFGILSEIDDTSTMQSPLFFYPADTGSYNVGLTVRTNHGCESYFEYPVLIGPDILVYIPNAFSPDVGGPLANEGFRAVVNDAAKEYELIIFDRWGEVIWSTTNKLEQWDGNYGSAAFDNRLPVPAGVYAYYLKIKSWNDKSFEYSGTVTLIR